MEIEEIISKLNELLIKQDFLEKQKGKTTYIKKTRVYKDLIKWFKSINKEQEYGIYIKK
jgi:hypothetical protein